MASQELSLTQTAWVVCKPAILIEMRHLTAELCHYSHSVSVVCCIHKLTISKVADKAIAIKSSFITCGLSLAGVVEHPAGPVTDSAHRAVTGHSWIWACFEAVWDTPAPGQRPCEAQ